MAGQGASAHIVATRPHGATLRITGREAREDAERLEHFLAGGSLPTSQDATREETLRFLAGFDGLTMQRLSYPDEEAEHACLQAFVSSVVAMAGGRLDLVSVRR
ncbi:hypothetical protein QF034_000660 [Streptomyces africanus]|uniref:Uncharacterized protein n=1 Tax=Streptomyces africanus TaxID=231024 RepID=A0ABU0QIL7_9ACTN|nr:hypothetical protein [Streptomyces africanus]